MRNLPLSACDEVGALLCDVEDAALLVGASRDGFPIVGVSAGFRRLTGFASEDLLGRSPDVLLENVPDFAVSRSGQKNFRNYCHMCGDLRVEGISETSVVQPNARKDGSQFVAFSLLGLCEVRRNSYILIVHRHIAEGVFARISKAQTMETLEEMRAAFARIRSHLRVKSAPPCDSDHLGSGLSEEEARPPCPPPRRRLLRSRGHRRTGTFGRRQPGLPDFSFFAGRLQDHSILRNEGYSVERREPEELASGSIVFSDVPVRHSREGLGFQLRVERTTPKFSGLPLLGFTRRRPLDKPDLYPELSRCLGQSVLVGADGEAFARDKSPHLQMGYKKPSQEDLQTWKVVPGEGIPKLSEGDTLGCRYTREGRMQLLVNGALALDFDVGRPPDAEADYYAVVDVCLSAVCLTVLCSGPETPCESACTSMDVLPTIAATPVGSACPTLDVLPTVSLDPSLDLLPTVSLDGSSSTGSTSPTLEELPVLDAKADVAPQVIPSSSSVRGGAGPIADAKILSHEPALIPSIQWNAASARGDAKMLALYTSLWGVVPPRFLACP